MTKTEIRVDGDPAVAVDETIKAIAESVYQRSGSLVDVIRAPLERNGEFHPVGTPSIRGEIPTGRLREIIAANVVCIAKKDGEDKIVAIPGWLVTNVRARGEYSYIPPLDGITYFPVVNADGNLVCTDGYDASTRLYCEIESSIDVPEKPTKADAENALSLLEDLVSDFPFSDRTDRMTWVALILTQLARPAVAGPVPLFLIQAPAQGSGKTLLANLAGHIVHGREVPRMAAPTDASEWDKRIMSVAIDGRPYLIIDNVVHTLRSDALDMVLTSTTYTGRILGKSESPTLPWRATIAVTLNNGAISSDIARRALQVRLDSEVERPEHRDGFAHPDIIAHVTEHRDDYLCAALTILRAYFSAGKPVQKMRAMGSYERWSNVVRGAILFAGGPDPITTQDSLREEADVDRDGERDLVNAWHEAFGEDPKLLSEVVSDLENEEHNPKVKTFAFSLAQVCGTRPGQLPDIKTIGYRLRNVKGKVVEGLRLTSKRSKAGQRWVCRPVQG